MFRKTGWYASIVMMAALMTSCVGTKSSVVVSTEDQYTVIGVAKNEVLALNNAKKKAQWVCATQRKQTVSVMSQIVKDNRARRDLKITNQAVSRVAFATNDVADFPHLSKDQDYEATLVFTCEHPQSTRCHYCFRVSNKFAN